MKLISNDLRDGEKLPHRHVFNGMDMTGIIFPRTWHGMMCPPGLKALS